MGHALKKSPHFSLQVAHSVKCNCNKLRGFKGISRNSWEIIELSNREKKVPKSKASWKGKKKILQLWDSGFKLWVLLGSCKNAGNVCHLGKNTY